MFQRIRTSSLPHSYAGSLLAKKPSIPSISSFFAATAPPSPPSSPPSEPSSPPSGLMEVETDMVVFPSSSSSMAVPSGSSRGGWMGGGKGGGGGGAVKVVGLSRPKLEMARRLLGEALEEDGKGQFSGNKDEGEYIVHLLTLSISTIKSSVPTSYLDTHVEAREALEGPMAEGRGEGGGSGGDWKEEVVNGIVGGLGWLKGSGIPTHLLHFVIFLSQVAVILASRLRLREIFLLVLTAVATSPHLQTLHRFLLDVLWIGFETFTRGVVVLGGAGGDRDRPYDDRRRRGDSRSRRRFD